MTVIGVWHRSVYGPTTPHLVFRIALKLAEECGEVADLLSSSDDPMSVDRALLADELADVSIVAAVLADRFGIGLPDAVEAKLDRLFLSVGS